jgi:hypothetical protein
MSYGLPENKSPGANQLGPNAAEQARSGIKRTVADLALNGNYSSDVINEARSGCRKNPNPMPKGDYGDFKPGPDGK